jgi:hypothetical protein
MFACAADEAHEMRSSHIEVGHFLLGILAGGQPAATLLAGRGIRLPIVREKLAAYIAERSAIIKRS